MHPQKAKTDWCGRRVHGTSPFPLAATSALNKYGVWRFIKMMPSRRSQLKFFNVNGIKIPVSYDVAREVAERIIDEKD